jgi:hypothetical protein
MNTIEEAQYFGAEQLELIKNSVFQNPSRYPSKFILLILFILSKDET